MILQIKLLKDAKFEENKTYSVLYQVTLEAGYTDVTNTISGWYSHGKDSGKDYKYVRDQIINLITDFNALTYDQKRMCGEFMAPDPYTILNDGILGDDYNDWLEDWMIQGKEARIERLNAFKLMGFNLIVESKKALNKIIVDSLHEKYINGIDSKAIDGETGLYDWVESTDSYALLGGLKNSGYTPTDSGMTINDVSVSLMDIIKNGNY